MCHPLVEEVELVSSNPQYALIKFSNGREDTVSVRDLAPVGTETHLPLETAAEMLQESSAAGPLPTPPANLASPAGTNKAVLQEKIADVAGKDSSELRRSTRTRREPEWLEYS